MYLYQLLLYLSYLPYAHTHTHPGLVVSNPTSVPASFLSLPMYLAAILSKSMIIVMLKSDECIVLCGVITDLIKWYYYTVQAPDKLSVHYREVVLFSEL